jgi:heme A synthase
MAGVVAISTVVLTVTLVFFSRAPRGLKALALVTTLLLMAQILFGALTVWLMLQANVVATHLGLGTAFFGMLYWQHLRLKREAAASAPVLGRWYPALLVAVYAQLLLGGLVASRYAALACPDFPTCLGQWVPTWLGPVGIHVIHRFGAYTLSALVLANFVLTRTFSGDRRLRRASAFMMGLVLVQVGLGIANVLLRVPPIIGVAHLATATGLLALALRQTSTITPRA